MGFSLHTMYLLTNPQSARRSNRSAGLKPAEVKLMSSLSDRLPNRSSPEVSRRVSGSLEKMIEAKRQGKSVEIEEPATRRATVIDKMTALKKSLAATSQPLLTAPSPVLRDAKQRGSARMRRRARRADCGNSISQTSALNPATIPFRNTKFFKQLALAS
jgi:non-homologous end joining protein Ku